MIVGACPSELGGHIVARLSTDAVACMQWRDVRLVSIQSKRVRIPQLKTSKLPAAAKAFINPVLSDRYVPTASETHFLVKLLLAAPASFLSFADASHVVSASFSHFSVKLVSAAPASFFSAACALQVGRSSG